MGLGLPEVKIITEPEEEAVTHMLEGRNIRPEQIAYIERTLSVIA